MKPKISFVTPNYNNGDLLPRMLESTLDQDYAADEIILIDDGSTDDSIFVIESWQKKYPQIKLIRQDRNRGIVHSVNRGLELAEGELIVLRSADDVSYPSFLSKSVSMMQVHPQAGYCCADIGVFTNDPSDYVTRSQTWSNESRYFSPTEFARAFCGSEFWGNSCMIRADAIKEAGNYIPELRWNCDWFMYMVIAARHGVCYIPEVLAGMRYDEKSYCNQGVQDFNEHKDACLHMFELLLSDSYRDVIPFFNLSGCMGTFGAPLAEMVLIEPSCWNSVTQTMTWRNFGMLNELHAQKGSGIPARIASILKKNKAALQKLFEENENVSVAVYGAGGHTITLLNEWSSLNLPSFDAVVVSQKVNRSDFLGIPVQEIANVAPDQFDLIVISSKSFEFSMAANCKEQLPKTPILAIWDTQLTSFGKSN